MQNDIRRRGRYEAPRIEFETLLADTIMCSGEPAGCKENMGSCDYMAGKLDKNKKHPHCIVGC